MGIREVMKARRAVKTVDVPMPLLGEGIIIKVKRLSTKRYLELSKLPHAGLEMVLEAALDEQGVPLYTDMKDISGEEGDDWALTEALIDACNGVNKLTLADAQKNSGLADPGVHVRPVFPVA